VVLRIEVAAVPTISNDTTAIPAVIPIVNLFVFNDDFEIVRKYISCLLLYGICKIYHQKMQIIYVS
jgi:hypothetical protein